MDKVLLDSDILSEIYKGISPSVMSNATSYLQQHARLSFSSISVHEVLFGLYAKNALRRAEDFSLRISVQDEIVPTTEDYRLAARIRADLQRAGTPIGNFDPLIAACAIERAWPLVTGNTRHYGFIQNAGFALQLTNWRDAI